MGDRVCIDCISILKENEGCLIGSSSKLMAFIHGETLPGEYVPARPFRVNCGPVHSYIMMADGSTKYLSEVVAGDSVKIVSTSDSSGQLESRAVTVGRCKIEPRPMILVEFMDEKTGSMGQIFLQQAETVRLMSPRLDAPDDVGVNDVSRRLWRKHHVVRPVTDLKVGEKIYVAVNEFGTHVGKRIVSNVRER